MHLENVREHAAAALAAGKLLLDALRLSMLTGRSGVNQGGGTGRGNVLGDGRYSGGFCSFVVCINHHSGCTWLFFLWAMGWRCGVYWATARNSNNFNFWSDGQRYGLWRQLRRRRRRKRRRRRSFPIHLIERDAEDGGERADVRVVLRVVVDQEAMEIQDEGCSHVLQKRAGVH